MMDPVHPWVDPSEMRRLAEALMQAPAKQPQAPEDAGFGGDFVGYAGPVAPHPAPRVAEMAPIVPEEIPEITPPAPVIPAAVLPTISPPVVAPAPPQPEAPLLQPEIFLESESATTPPPAAPILERPVVRAPAALVAPPPVVNVAPPPPVVFPAYQPASDIPKPAREEKSMPEQIAEAALRAQQVLAEAAAAAAIAEAQRPSETIAPPPPAVAPAPEPVPPSPLAVAAHPHIATTTPVAPPPPLRPTLTPAPPPPVLTQHTAPVKVRGPFLERMSRFRDGLHGQFAAKGVFILDKEGAVIFDESDHSRLHFMARSLAMAAKKSNDGPGNVHVKVGSTTMLEVIPVDTVFGRIVLGLLVEQPLSADAVIRIISALQMAVAPPNH